MSGSGEFAAAEAALWRRHLPLVRGRVSAIEAAAREAAAGALTPATRAGAQAEAHRLAGALDSYGRTGGSALARAAEELLREAPADIVGVRLGPLAGRIRELVEDGAGEPGDTPQAGAPEPGGPEPGGPEPGGPEPGGPQAGGPQA